jgi:hypothetical protein
MLARYWFMRSALADRRASNYAANSLPLGVGQFLQSSGWYFIRPSVEAPTTF